MCTLTTVGEGGTKIEESIQIKSLGKQHVDVLPIGLMYGIHPAQVG